MFEIARPRPDPKTVRAVLEHIPPKHLNRASNPTPTPDEIRRLTRIHEAAHAVACTVITGFCCNSVSSAAAAPQTDVGREGQYSELGDDLIDLVAVFAELKLIEPSHGTSLGYFHIEKATHDFEKSFARTARRGENGIEWATRVGPLARRFVDDFWAAISAVAAALEPRDSLTGEEVRQLVSDHRAPAVAVNDLKALVRTEYVMPPRAP
jgi:hypothetical protein